MLGLARPPRWGVVVLAVLLVANVALFSFLLLRPAPADPFAGALAAQSRPTPASEPAGEATSSTASQTPTPAPEPVVLAVYGDGYSAGSSLGGQGASGWPALVAAETGADLRLNAVSQAGYESVGTTGQTFPDLVAANPVPDATVTIVFGSRNDLGADPADVRAAAEQTLMAIRAIAPETTLLVIGPAWSSSQVPDALQDLRDAVEEAAQATDAVFVDPVADQWFADPTGLIASDGVSPLDAGNEYLAGLITPTVQTALRAT